MKSRWALDCNLTPDFILIAVSLIISGYNSLPGKKRSLYYAAGCIFFILAAYGYGVSWFMLPLFVLFSGIYLYRKDKIKICQAGICLVTMIIFAWPLILFAINLVPGGEQYRIGSLTITQLKESRLAEATLPGDGNVFFVVWDAVRVMLLGDDKLAWNGFRYIGQFYNILGIPFFALACIRLIKRKGFNIFDALFALWLIASVPVALMVGPNANHWNVLWFPIIYFVARGIVFCVEKVKWAKGTAISLICVLTVIFTVKYFSFFGENNQANNWFSKGIEDKIRFTQQNGFDYIYFSGTVFHVVPLFYSPVSPYDFDRTKEVLDKDMALEQMKKYCNNYFYLPEKILPTSKTAYIISNHDLEKYVIEYDKFNVDKGDFYTLLWTD
jgi:hypothetical protein